jgi:two-component system nitrogen regulation sensor histidine kinase NtrY
MTLFVLGPLLALETFVLIGGPFSVGAENALLRFVLLFDLVYVLVVAALVINRIFRIIVARRAKSAGSRLHLRLAGVFTVVALTPTILVAIFAMLTINMGLEAWFSERVRNAIGAALTAAETYELEQYEGLNKDIRSLKDFIDDNLPAIQRNGFPVVLAQGQSQIQRGLKEAYVIDGASGLRVRGIRSYLFFYEAPTPQEVQRAEDGQIVFILDGARNELRALIKLSTYIDRYLYVTREVDGALLALLDDTQQMAQLYQQQEQERGRRLFEFGLIYLGFALILILAAIWLSLWFAERLSRPVGRLAGAAQRVGAGDMNVRVPQEKGDDEIAMLGRYFNEMTKQLKAQRDALLSNTRQIEDRQRVFDSVLGSVTSGVVGVNPERQIEFINRAALDLLNLPDGSSKQAIEDAVPEFSALIDKVEASKSQAHQEEVRVVRRGRIENLLVRVAKRRDEADALIGYVVAFDDVTDLVSAQRMAAWGDVARRIAHEVKNPLTPIKLSAERIKRRFAKALPQEEEAVIAMTDTIIRQTDDLRRIVDDFSKFARMPEPDRVQTDIAKVLRDALALQSVAAREVSFVEDIPKATVNFVCDATLMSQVFINLIKNAVEAIEARRNRGHVFEAVVKVQLTRGVDMIEIAISDTGIGLPQDRGQLFEPYVTTRDEGTGLGLSIVKKIVEEHDGTMHLDDAEFVDTKGHRGAKAVMIFKNMGDHEQTKRSEA